jgi:hypothetical protein
MFAACLDIHKRHRHEQRAEGVSWVPSSRHLPASEQEPAHQLLCFRGGLTWLPQVQAFGNTLVFPVEGGYMVCYWQVRQNCDSVTDRAQIPLIVMHAIAIEYCEMVLFYKVVHSLCVVFSCEYNYSFSFIYFVTVSLLSTNLVIIFLIHFRFLLLLILFSLSSWLKL